MSGLQGMGVVREITVTVMATQTAFTPSLSKTVSKTFFSVFISKKLAIVVSPVKSINYILLLLINI